MIHFRDLGRIAYKEAWDYQSELLAGIVARKVQNREVEEGEKVPTDNYLLFCEHPHVYTLGKSGDMANVLLSEAELKEKKIEFFKINRGGDITYHGPGQIVGYPILDLDNFFTDIHKYLRLLEEAIILTLADYGLKGGRIEKATGVWVDVDSEKPRKICAMGIRASRWVTMHGWAFNVNVDMAYFDYIVPCGIVDKGVTSLNRELGVEWVDVGEVKERLLGHFMGLFEAEAISNDKK